MSHRDSFFSLIKPRIWLYLGIAVCIGIIFILYFNHHHKYDLPIDIYKQGALIAKESEFTLPIVIAETEAQQECGLSFSSQLPKNTGMLFDFSTTDGLQQHPFWMRDMKYALDIIWLDESGTIVGIHESVYPETFPATFDAEVESMYVLEVPVGFVRMYENALSLGKTFTMYKHNQHIQKVGPTLCE